MLAKFKWALLVGYVIVMDLEHVDTCVYHNWAAH